MRIIDKHYKNALLKAQGSEFLNDDFVVPDEEVVEGVPQSELEKVIYQVNPSTGLPDSDLMIMNDQKVSPQLRMAIQNRNHVVNPSAPSSFDEDAILDEAQTPFESTEDYHERLNDEAQDFVNSHKKEE